eukprot:8266152-Alexandrium_andersonii.AAC.1
MPGATTLKVSGAGPVGTNRVARHSTDCACGPSMGQLSSWRCAVAQVRVGCAVACVGCWP